MLKVTNKLEDKEILVTRGAYENLYKSLGYKIVEDKKEQSTPKVDVPSHTTIDSFKDTASKGDENDILMDSVLVKRDNRKKN